MMNEYQMKYVHTTMDPDEPSRRLARAYAYILSDAWGNSLKEDILSNFDFQIRTTETENVHNLPSKQEDC
jgi:hypothetical protein